LKCPQCFTANDRVDRIGKADGTVLGPSNRFKALHTIKMFKSLHIGLIVAGCSRKQWLEKADWLGGEVKAADCLGGLGATHVISPASMRYRLTSS